MGIEGVWLGYGFEMDYTLLADKIKINIGKSIPIEKLQEYVNKNKIKGLQFSVLEKSHTDDKSDEDYDSFDDMPRTVYFGVYLQLGDYDCWNKTTLNPEKEKQLNNLITTGCHQINKITLKMFGKKCKLMTIVSGCPCCS